MDLSTSIFIYYGYFNICYISMSISARMRAQVHELNIGILIGEDMGLRLEKHIIQAWKEEEQLKQIH